MKNRVPTVAPMNVLYKFFSLDYFLDAMVKNEMQVIELWGGAPHVYIEEMSLQQMQQLKKQVGSRGLTVCCLTPEINLYPVNIAAEETYIRKRSIEYLLKSVDLASELQIPIVQVTSGSGYYHEPNGEAWKRSRDSLETLLKRAEALQISLSLEPLLPYETNLVNDLSSAQKMLEEIDSSLLGIHVDTVSMEAAGDGLEDYFRVFGNRVKHIQLCDGPNGHLTWGDGSFQLDKFIDIIVSNPYQGYLGLEIFDHKYYVDPDQALHQGLHTLRNLIDKESFNR